MQSEVIMYSVILHLNNDVADFNCSVKCFLPLAVSYGGRCFEIFSNVCGPIIFSSISCLCSMELDILVKYVLRAISSILLRDMWENHTSPLSHVLSSQAALSRVTSLIKWSLTVALRSIEKNHMNFHLISLCCHPHIWVTNAGNHFYVSVPSISTRRALWDVNGPM